MPFGAEPSFHPKNHIDKRYKKQAPQNKRDEIISFIQIDPMTFMEFLLANGEENLAKYLEDMDTIEPISDAFFNSLYEIWYWSQNNPPYEGDHEVFLWECFAISHCLWQFFAENCFGEAILSSAAVFRITENIISNALRYCKEKIEVDISFSQPFLIVMITDDGKGFSQKDLAKATNNFYKGKSSKSHFGIGLSICKMLSEKYGGFIQLDNLPEKGARVIVKIKTENLSALWRNVDKSLLNSPYHKR